MKAAIWLLRCASGKHGAKIVAQRQMSADTARSMSDTLGCGLLASSAAADMIWPDWQ